jgi:hypothetical protein
MQDAYRSTARKPGYKRSPVRGRWVTRHSVPGGVPYQIWEGSMPRISDTYTDCAVYIYSSIMDAQVGSRQGGSGFLVAVRQNSIRISLSRT